MRFRFLMVAACIAAICLPAEAGADDFALQDGERVLLIGNTLVEREQTYGDWEMQLTLAAPGRKIVFRNLGWSGDTVWAESRGIFDPPAAGYKRLIDLVKELKPTTVILGYGTVESEAGQAGLEKFVAQYKKLRQDLQVGDVRFIHLSPVLLESATFPVKAENVQVRVTDANKNLNLYAEAIRTISNENGELFIDFRTAQRKQGDQSPWTENGVHLSQRGYAATGDILVQELGGKSSDGEFAELRSAIQRKNELFFHRWRPQNITYLLGFRKHEQGNNAVEIAQFDPLVAEMETKIRELSQQSQKD